MNVLLHTCCGPCASACVPRLKAEGHRVTMLFANSNIDTEAEFEKRLAAARKLADAEGVELVALSYDHADWCAKVAVGFEDAPEKGARCARCFRYNLAQAAAFARAHGYEAVTTSLTISPHKVSEMVFAAGEEATSSARQQDCALVGEATSSSLRERAQAETECAKPSPLFLRENFKKNEGFKESLRRSAELGLYRQDYCGCEFSRFEALVRKYDAYVSTFRDADGKLPPMMQLKRTHTAFVVDNARRIARAEKFDPPTYAAALAAALLHDTGRYEQLRRYDTFRDSDSVDHAVFSHDIVVEKGWLEEGDEVKVRGVVPQPFCACPHAQQGEISGAPARCAGGPAHNGVIATSETLPHSQKYSSTADAILKAVLYHNRRELPPELEHPLSTSSLHLSSTSTSFLHLAFLLAHTVRDADKLDIFRVLEDQVAHTDWRKDSRAFWNLKVSAPPNPAVVEAIENHRPVDYQNIKALADFVLIQVGWMMNELHFAASRRLCAERGHLAFRRDFLHQLTDDPAIDRICDLAEKGLR